MGDGFFGRVLSITVAEAGAGGKKTDQRSNPEGDPNGLIGMLVHGLVGSSGSFDGLVADTARNFPGAIQSVGEPLAGFPDFFSGHVGGGGHQGLCIFGQPAHVILDCLRMSVHIFCAFCLLFD
jgi:hypothetical protein